MQCKCGGEVKSSSHEVKTKKGLAEWSDVQFNKHETPYTITKQVCDSCGRNGKITVETKIQ